MIQGKRCIPEGNLNETQEKSKFQNIISQPFLFRPCSIPVGRLLFLPLSASQPCLKLKIKENLIRGCCG